MESNLPSVADFVSNTLSFLILVAGFATTFFLVKGGYEFITSQGSPDALSSAKKTVRNAVIGLVMVLGAGVIAGILHASFSPFTNQNFLDLPHLEPIAAPEGGLGQIIVDAIGNFLTNIVNNSIQPISEGILKFLQKTPELVANKAIFNFWLFILGVTNSLFVLVIALIGFQFMSASTFGFEEMELKKILPRIGLGFLGANTSIFLIDWLVRLNNTLVNAVLNQFGGASRILTEFLPPLTAVMFLNIIMLFFIILAIILLTIYISRLVVIALGAVLSPIFFLLWTFPKFADYTEVSTKAYLVTIFSTFVHAVILQLGSSFLVVGGDPFVSRLVAIGLILVLIKSTPSMVQMVFYSSSKSLIRNTSGQIMNVINSLNPQGNKREVTR